METNSYKNNAYASKLCQLAKDQMKRNNFVSAVDYYTLALIHAPAFIKRKFATATSNGLKEEYPLAFIYCERSLAMFRLKKYDDCIVDVKRSFANGKHDSTRYVSLINRIAWCYWHLKSYKKCQETVETAKIDDTNTCKEFEVLKQLLTKTKSKLENGNKTHLNDQQNSYSPKESVSYGSSLYCGENSTIKGVTTCATFNKDPVKGRYLTANKTIKPGHVLVDEEVYAGVLNENFLLSHCNFCFKECNASGIPCYGCSKALYCDEKCRLLAWQSYHWLECCMWPVINTLDILGQVSLRILLCTAHGIDDQASKSSHCLASPDCFASIADYLHNNTNVAQNKAPGKRKSLKKTTKQTDSSCSDGFGRSTNTYNRDYWSVFCLQTHEEKNSKVVMTKCALFATYLAKILHQIVAIPKRKPHKLSSGECPPNSTKETAHNLSNSLKRLSLNGCLGDTDGSTISSLDMEKFRKKALELSQNAALDAPTAKLKPQSCFLSKDLPKTFQDIVSYLLRRHLLQLHTNCQAIYDIVLDKSQTTSQVSRVSQQRIASAIFTSTSLLNHSCNPNTVVNFVGRRVMIRAGQSIIDGHVISHCYGPSISRHSFKDRQKMLKEQYHFDCECLTCAKYKSGDHEDQVFLQQFTAYRCDSCDGPILILDVTPTTDASVHGRCANEACKRVYELSESHKSLNMIVSMSNSLSQRLMYNPNPQDLQGLEKCLAQMQVVLFRNHHAVASLHDQLAFHYSESKDYVSAARHVTSSLKITAMRFGAKSVEASQEMYKLGTLYFNGQKTAEAEKFLGKALDVHRDLPFLDPDEHVRAQAMLLALKSLK